MKQQNIVQFMDEEDRGQQIIGQNLVIKDQYQLLGFGSGKGSRRLPQDDIISDEYNNLFESVSKSIGYEIYNNIKTKKYK